MRNTALTFYSIIHGLTWDLTLMITKKLKPPT